VTLYFSSHNQPARPNVGCKGKDLRECLLFSTEITEINHGKSLAKGGSDREKLKKKMGHFFLTQGLSNKKKTPH